MSTIPAEKEIVMPEVLPKILHRDKLTEIANYVLEGLSEYEACILAGFPPAQFKEIKQSNEGISIFLQKKSIEFKRNHLRTITAKPNEKNSMWLLESLRPEEFGAKRKGGDTTINVIGAIIKDVQKNNMLPVKEQDALPAGVREMQTLSVKDILK